jgi:hypothetical protein
MSKTPQPSREPPAAAGHYTIRQPGKADRTFSTSDEALQYLLGHPGFAKMFGKDGELMLTRGTPEPDG